MWVARRIFACAALTTACGGAPIPDAERASAEAAVTRATRAGAASFERAGAHLAMARGELAEAAALVAAGRHEQAALLLARAEADARLARELARAASLHRRADDAERELERERLRRAGVE
jgi:hypothetical protein